MTALGHNLYYGPSGVPFRHPRLVSNLTHALPGQILRQILHQCLAGVGGPPRRLDRFFLLARFSYRPLGQAVYLRRRYITLPPELHFYTPPYRALRPVMDGLTTCLDL